MNKLKNLTWFVLMTLLSFTACNNLDDYDFGSTEGDVTTEKGVTELIETFDSVEDKKDLSLEGWTLANPRGDRNWQGAIFQTDQNKYIQASAHNGKDSDYEYWVISPALNVKDATKKSVSFDVQYDYWNETSLLEVYVMKNNTLSAERTLLSPKLPTQEDPNRVFMSTGDIDLSDKGDVVFIGIRYIAKGGASNSTTYRVDNFVFGTDFDKPEPPVVEGGTKEDPFTVAEAFTAQGQNAKWVKGYIVGCVKNGTGSFDTPDQALFENFDSNTNVFIADSPEETDYTKCLSVKLNDKTAPEGMRDAVGLMTNPGNKGKILLIEGNLKAMFTNLKGLRDITAYELEGGAVPTETIVTFTSSAVTSVMTEAAYTYDVKTNVVNGKGNTVITASGLPAWASLKDNNDGTATISGTAPAAEEVSNIVITATNNNVVAEQAYTLAVVKEAEPGGDKGTKDNPYNVAEALAAQGQNAKWVSGYLVGCIKNGTATFDSPDQALFDNFDSSTNVFIADSPTETDYTKCLSVKLNDKTAPSGMRSAVNLLDNPANKGKILLIEGNLKAMFTNLKGLRDITGYELK
ncbi:MAG: DUF6359 domain-containing protein [Bacteroidales bacterium]